MVVSITILNKEVYLSEELASNERRSPYANTGGEKHRCRIHQKIAHRKGDREPAKIGTSKLM